MGFNKSKETYFFVNEILKHPKTKDYEEIVQQGDHELRINNYIKRVVIVFLC